MVEEFWDYRAELMWDLGRLPYLCNELELSKGCLSQWSHEKLLWGSGKAVTMCTLSGSNMHQTIAPHQLQPGTQGSRVACLIWVPR